MASSTVRWTAASGLILVGVVGLAWAQGVPMQSNPFNPKFETAYLGAPTDWQVMKANGRDEYRFESVPGLHGKGGRLSLAAAPDPAREQYGAIYQELAAQSWRGQRVRFRASLKVSKPGAAVGLGLRVERPGPKSAGFTDMMQGEGLQAGDWITVEIVGRVAPDAKKIWIGVNARGDADVTIDDVSFEAVPVDPTPPSPEARAYLDAAIAILRDKHIDSAKADWPRIIADAYADIGGAKTPRDTYPAIRGVLGALGEKHSFLVAAPRAAGPKAGGTPPRVSEAPMPTSELLDGRFGVVRLPQLGALGPTGQADGERYTQTLRTALETMDKAPLCGWIVDLRRNGGGNMWPMLRGLDPLLGAAPFGTFVDTKNAVQLWQRQGGMIFPAARAAPAEPPLFGLAHAGAPLAVLIGPETASSGEMTAIALIGRSGVRSFGANSGGYVTGNSAVPLSDGAFLVVTGVFVRDRTGKPYDERILPDVLAADAQGEAVQWLTAQCKP